MARNPSALVARNALLREEVQWTLRRSANLARASVFMHEMSPRKGAGRARQIMTGHQGWRPLDPRLSAWCGAHPTASAKNVSRDPMGLR